MSKEETIILAAAANPRTASKSKRRIGGVGAAKGPSGPMWIVFAVLCAVLPFSVAEAACSLWDVGGQFTVTQTNGYAPVFQLSQSATGRITGSASYEKGPSGFVTKGTVAENSNISNSQFTVVIQWDNKTRGSYNGHFDSSGKLSGNTCDELHPKSPCADWSVNNRRFACLRP